MKHKGLNSVIFCVDLLIIYTACMVSGYPEYIVISGSNFDTSDFSESASFFPANQNNSLQYLLYTPDHPKEVCYLEPQDSNGCSFNNSYELKLLIHGYDVQLLPGNLFEQIKDTLLKYKKYNVIIVDWTKYNDKFYLVDVVNSYLVAIHVGKMINFLVANRGMNPSSIHIIGHSLGAHVAGVAGKQVPNLGRVTGLDPAGPLFFEFIRFYRLSDDSAQLVDVIHTSVGLGINYAIGSIDFYPNGGKEQPACQIGKQYQTADAVVKTLTSALELPSCCHNLVLFYFMKSIDSCNYQSVECANYEMFLKDICDSDSHLTNRMGLFCEKIPGLPSKSKFYLNTTANPPFCENENE